MAERMPGFRRTMHCIHEPAAEATTIAITEAVTQAVAAVEHCSHLLPLSVTARTACDGVHTADACAAGL